MLAGQDTHQLLQLIQVLFGDDILTVAFLLGFMDAAGGEEEESQQGAGDRAYLRKGEVVRNPCHQRIHVPGLPAAPMASRLQGSILALFPVATPLPPPGNSLCGGSLCASQWM